MILLVLFLFVLTFIGYYNSKSYFTPEVVSPASWGLILLFYLLVDHGMFDISSKTMLIIALWNISLLGGVYFIRYTNLLSIKKTKHLHPDGFYFPIRRVYYLITLIGFLPTIYKIFQQAKSINAGNIFFNLRMANTGIIETDYNIGILKYVITFSFVSYMIELYSYFKSEHKNKRRLIVTFIINLIFSVATMAKTSFLFLFLSTLFVIAHNKNISRKSLITTVLAVLIFMSSIQLLRTDSDPYNRRNEISNMFTTYMFGGIVALDQIANSPMKSKYEGQNTFAFLNNFKNKIGIGAIERKEYENSITSDGYFYTPYPTNVYTVIGPFWLDFGFKGVISISFILGLLAGFFNKLAVRGKSWGVILNAYFLCVLLLQFFGEYIFTNMSYLLQLILLCYIAYKLHYKIVWRKSTSYSPHIMGKSI